MKPIYFHANSLHAPAEGGLRHLAPLTAGGGGALGSRRHAASGTAPCAAHAPVVFPTRRAVPTGRTEGGFSPCDLRRGVSPVGENRDEVCCCLGFRKNSVREMAAEVPC